MAIKAKDSVITELLKEQLSERYPQDSALFDFSVNDLVKSCGYDIKKDLLKVSSSLSLSLEEHYKNIDTELKNIPSEIKDEKQRYFSFERSFKHATKISVKYEQDLLNIARFPSKNDYRSFFQQQIEEEEKNKEIEIKVKTTQLSIKKNEREYEKRKRGICKSILSWWEKSIEEREREWCRQTIEKQRTEFIERIKEWLELMQRFFRAFESMGDAGEIFKEYIMRSLRRGLESGKRVSDVFDEDELNRIALGSSSSLQRQQGVGFGVDNSVRRPLNLLRFLQILESESVKKLCDMLGKLAKAEKKKEMEKYTVSQTYTDIVPLPNSKEEIVGVTLGRDLENLLPQELAMMFDDDFSILFDLKYIENRLFCFDRQSYVGIEKTKEVEMKREKEVEDKKGPIIMCVDTSGSMSGEPETIAKTVALSIAKRAMEQERPCYLINFSTNIDTIDLTPPCTLFELEDFLSMSFCGGTDSIPALQEGLHKMQEENYKKADLIIMSDFIFSGSNEVEVKELLAKKDKSNRCFALYIGNFTKSNLRGIFDGEFFYNTVTGDVDSLCEVFSDIHKKIETSET